MCIRDSSHAGEYVVGVVSDGEVGCDIERNVNAPLEIAEHYFHSTEREYIEAASDPGKAFFTLWTLKESYMKMTGRGMSLPLDSFEIIRKDQGFVLGKSPKRDVYKRQDHNSDRSLDFPKDQTQKFYFLYCSRSKSRNQS